MTRLREVTGFALLIAGVLGTPLLLAGVAALGTNHPGIQPWTTRLDRWRSLLRRKKT